MTNWVVPASFPSLEVVTEQVRNSKYSQFKAENGCYPWGLSKPLTCFLSIPGIGIIPSFICWAWKGQQVDKMDDVLMQRRSSITQKRDEESGDASSSLITDETGSAANSTTQTENVSRRDSGFSREDSDLWERRRLLAAQKTNSAVIFFTNTILSIIVVMAILQRYDKL